MLKAAAPDVPTVAEAGVGADGYDVVSWNGLAAPAGTPTEILDKLNQAIHRADSPSLREKLATIGMVPFMTSREEAADYLDAAAKQWRPVIEDLNLSLD